MTFETDKFSTYAVTYSDVDKEIVKDQDKDPESKGDTEIKNEHTGNPSGTQTGDDNRLFLMIAIFCFAIVMVIVGVRNACKKKINCIINLWRLYIRDDMQSLLLWLFCSD